MRRHKPDAAYERETVINFNDAEALATIYTAQPTMMRRMQRNPLATLMGTHRDDRGRVTGMEFEVSRKAVLIRASLRTGSLDTSRAREMRKRALDRQKLAQSDHPRGRSGMTRSADSVEDEVPV